MNNDIELNVELLRKKVPNLTVAARSVGLRPATVSNLCTGKIPLGRAEVRTLVSLAELAECKLDDLVIKKGEVSMVETGIKVIDFFAPLVKGGTIGLVARPGMGQLVVLTELFNRFKKQGYKTIFLSPDENEIGIRDVLTETDFHSSNFDEIFEQVKNYGQSGEVILGVDRSIFLSDDFFSLQERFQEGKLDTIMYAVVDTSGEAVDEELPYGPLDTLLEFDMELSVNQFYPAVSRLSSTSTVLEGLDVESSHLKLQQQARKVLRRYKELKYLVEKRGLESLSEQDKVIFTRGERLEAYFTQYFYVAEEFTKHEGVHVSLKETLADVAAILDGKLDDKGQKELMYVSSIIN